MEFNFQINASIISIIGACVSFISMIISGVNAYSSRKSFRLQQKKYMDGNPNFEIKDILDSYAKNDKNAPFVQLYFLILLTNFSDKVMSMNKIRLRVIGEKNNIILTPSLQDGCAYDGENVKANSSLKKWIKFDIPKDQYGDLDILKYILEITDFHENKQEISTIFLREELVNYEGWME